MTEFRHSKQCINGNKTGELNSTVSVKSLPFQNSVCVTWYSNCRAAAHSSLLECDAVSQCFND